MTPMPSCRKAGPRDEHRPPSLRQGQRRASAPRRLPVCPPAHDQAGPRQHRNPRCGRHDLRGRAIAFGRGQRPDHRHRHRPVPLRRLRRRPGRIPRAAGRRRGHGQGRDRAGPGSAPGWPATMPTGTGCRICALTGTPDPTPTASTTPPTSTTGSLLGFKGTMGEALCRYRHKASYADLAVMPTMRRKQAGGPRRRPGTFGIITVRRGTPGCRRTAGSGRVWCPGERSGRSPVP